MRLIRRHWYSLGLVIVPLAMTWCFLGQLMGVQLILLLNFVILIVHQFEEYGIAYLMCFMGIGMMKIGYGLLGDKDSRYPFAPEEMERFDRRGHLARIKSAGTSTK